MGLLQNIFLGIGAISFVTFVALFGQLPALRRTPIGWLQRLLCIRLPARLHDVDVAITGGRITERGTKLGTYLFYEKNPIVLILYMSLLSSCALLFLVNASHLLPTSFLLGAYILLPLPYIFTYLCVAHTGHYITPASHTERLKDYPYDHILFRPHSECSTCNLTKPARSKHCSLCKACVAKCDHHCPWVNACLGRGNYRWFLALLLSLGVLEYYASYLCWWLMRDHLHFGSQAPLFSTAYVEAALDVLSRAIAIGGLSISGVGMLTLSTANLPLGLLAYHIYLIWAGMTTNESQKWSDLKEDMDDGCAFEASRSELRKYLGSFKGRSDGKRFLGLTGDAMDEPRARWPKSTDCVVARTNDGKPPSGQDHLWHRIWSLAAVDNIYDLGGWRNFLQVLQGR